MKKGLIFLICFVSLAIPSGDVIGNQEQEKRGPPVFRVEVVEVRVPTLVIKNKRVVRDLKKENFRVFIGKETTDGINWEQQEIKGFLPYEERGIALFIMIDLSRSVLNLLKEQITAADNFLVSLLRSPAQNLEDRAAIGSFLYRYQKIEQILPAGSDIIIPPTAGRSIVIVKGAKGTVVIGGEPREVQKFIIHIADRFKLHQGWTSDIGKLKSGLISANDPGGNTPLYDSLYWMGEEFESLEGDFTKIGVVITDGRDNASTKSVDETLEKLMGSQAMLYSVSVRIDEEVGRKILEKITGQTGGQLFVEPEAGNLKTHFDEIIKQIRGVYTLSFRAPVSPGKYFIKVEAGEHDKNLKWKQKKDYLVRHPKIFSIKK